MNQCTILCLAFFSLLCSLIIESIYFLRRSDVGTHFLNGWVLHYLFDELPKEKVNVNLNFFQSKHGKNCR